jgi:hypothetical protein
MFWKVHILHLEIGIGGDMMRPSPDRDSPASIRDFIEDLDKKYEDGPWPGFNLWLSDTS